MKNLINKIFSKSNWISLLIGVNLSAIIILKWNKIIEKLNVNEDKIISALRICLSLEIVGSILFLLILFQYRSAIMKKFFELRLTYRILLGFLSGIMVGIMLRFNPEILTSLGMDFASFKTLGKVFIDLIKMIITPLIFASIVCAVINIKDSKSTSKMALSSIITFMVMTLVSVSIGMGITSFVKPGKIAKIDVQELITSNKDDIIKISSSDGAKIRTLTDFVLDIIPDNVFKAFYRGNFLQVIFFSVIFGTAIRISKQQDKLIGKAMISLNSIMFQITDMVMQFAPFGIFGFVVWLLGSQDISLMKSLAVIIGIVYGSTLFMIYVLYGMFMFIVLKLNPFKFYKKIAPAQITGFLLASSSATLPMTLKIAQEKLGVSPAKALFVIPLGATINMNGTALNLGVNIIFISQIFNIDLTLTQLASGLILATLGAIGTAPVPGGSIFLLSGILSVFGIPPEAVALVLAIGRVLDMMRTFGNVTGDVLSAVVIDRLDGTLNERRWKTR